MTRALVIAMVAALCAGAAQAADEVKPMPAIVVHCPHLIDTQAGKMLGATSVVTDGQRIAEVVPGTVARDGATAIDLPADSTCLPGLIDAHTHLTSQFSKTSYSDQFRLNPADYAIRSTVYAQRTLLAGFTTVRNVGDDANESIALRNAINAGLVEGRASSPPASRSAAPAAMPIRPMATGWIWPATPDRNLALSIRRKTHGRRCARGYKDGADLIKIMPSGGVLDESSSADNAQLTLDEIKAVVAAAAHDYDFAVAAHAHGAEAIRRAVLGGVDSIEHGTFMDDADMKLMKQHGTWYVPTIIAGEFVEQKAGEGWYPPQVARRTRQVGPVILRTAGRAYKAGVKIAFDTDAGVYPHGQNAHEFELMVKAGMPPMYAIQAATTHAAQLLKHDKELGSIAPGKYTDVIAVPGNPLEDISLMKNVGFVMKAGVIYKRDGKAVVRES